MRLVALVECPQGQAVGQCFEAPDAQADVLILIGAARRASEDEPLPVAVPLSRRTYRRRNLTADA